MASIWLRATLATVEYIFSFALLALGVLLLYEAIRLGPGWGVQGPQPGFFPFILTMMMVVGSIGVLIITFRKPNRAPFFEASQEIVDLLKVGLPVLAAVFVLRWAGIYLTAGIYIGFFMAWYGGFRWYSAIAGGVGLAVVLWLLLTWGFRLPMPMSMFYRQGLLPV